MEGIQAVGAIIASTAVRNDFSLKFGARRRLVDHFDFGLAIGQSVLKDDVDW